MEELLKQGYKIIGENDGDGQHHHVFLARKKNGVWGYLIVEVSDDGEVYDMVGLANGKTIKLPNSEE